MSSWQVRPEGTQTATAVPSAGHILEAMQDGTLLPTDEVKGPRDADFVAIESHPAFEEAAAELVELPGEEGEETHLDMNPLIDVCLVLLIFFILTITYASLRYAVDIPQDTREGKGNPLPKVKPEDLKDRAFRVSAWMDGDTLVVRVEDKTLRPDPKKVTAEVRPEMERIIGSTGRRELILDVTGDVPWGCQTAILDAAKGAKVQSILYAPR